jgi:glycosyltransferase involved in cell wall biosynthesis
MAVDMPTVCLDDCGLADAVRATHGSVAGDSVASLATAIGESLEDAERRAASAHAGPDYVRDHASMGTIVRRLEQLYAEAIR